MAANKARVVIADDEFHMRAFISALLSKLDIEIVGQAGNGGEAVAMYRAKRPDLILLDINMPVKTGEEALAEIKREFPDAKAIMLTSVADFESVKQCLELGAVNYIRKDSPLPEIKAIVSEALGLKEHQP